MHEDFKELKEDHVENFRAKLENLCMGYDGYFNTQKLLEHQKVVLKQISS